MNTAPLLWFVVLQFGDLGTTLWFLDRGVAEANPLVGAALRLFASPAVALLVIKVGGCGLALIAWRLRRVRVLRVANLVFTLCVAWNLAAIAAA